MLCVYVVWSTAHKQFRNIFLEGGDGVEGFSLGKDPSMHSGPPLPLLRVC